MENQTKYCKYCGEVIDMDCVICPKCGKQIEELRGQTTQSPIIINNNTSSSASAASSSSTAVGGPYGNPKNKWISLLLCIFTLCGHKFYEGKIGMGILYLLTGGLFGIGWLIDIISLATKPTIYYV